MTDNKLRRLAISLYKDSEIHSKDHLIIKTIITYLMECKNNEATFHDIEMYFESAHGIIYKNFEISEMAKNYSNTFFIKLNRSKHWNSKIGLLPDIIEKENILEVESISSWEQMIATFYESFMDTLAIFDYNFVKVTIESYIFKITQRGFQEYRRLINGETANSYSKLHDDYNTDQKCIINEFINWNNVDKNKELHKAYSVGLHYYFVNSGIDARDQLKNIIGKHFYLDNNIIMRAIGVNKSDRKELILGFFEKSIEYDCKFYITKFTDKEFRRTLKHLISVLYKIKSGNMKDITNEQWTKISQEGGIRDAFREWGGKGKLDVQKFENHLMNEYLELHEKYNVEFIREFNEKESIIIEMMSDFRNSLPHYGKRNDIAIENDVKNLCLIQNLRNHSKGSFLDLKEYLLSTDQKLRSWDYKRSSDTPIVILPSQWLGLVLQIGNRSSDDYKSFVSFLNLNIETDLFSENELVEISDAISKIDSTINVGHMLQIMVDKRFKQTLHDKCMLENNTFDELIKSFVENQYVAENELLKNEQKKLIEENKEQEIKSIELLSKSSELESIISASEAKETEKKEQIRQSFESLRDDEIASTSAKYRNYRISFYIALAISILAVLGVCGLLFLKYISPNLPEWNNKLKDKTIQTTFIGVMAPFALTALYSFLNFLLYKKVIMKINSSMENKIEKINAKYQKIISEQVA